MKIFGWMHKKLQLGTDQYQRVANKNDPDVVINEESDTGKMDKATEVPLLHHHILLTIGTFGYSDPDPLLLLQPSQLPQSPINHHENSNNIDKQIEKARASALPSTEISKPELLIQEFGKDSTKQEVEITEEEDINMVEPLLEEDIKRSITEKRTTLADLFAAEPPTLSPAAAVPRILRTCGNNENNILKKVMEKNKFDEPRIKTIHGLIARMLRKRIYPVVVRVEDGDAGPLCIKDGTAKSEEAPNTVLGHARDDHRSLIMFKHQRSMRRGKRGNNV